MIQRCSVQVGDLVRSPSGDVGLLINVCLKRRHAFRVLFNYGAYDLPKNSLELINESK